MAVRRLVVRGSLALAVGAVFVVCLSTKSFAAETDPMKILYECKAACEKVKDFTAVFSKLEQIKDTLRETETVNMKLRYDPFSVYMHWIRGPKKGREIIYVEGEHDGKVVGHQTVGLLNFLKRTEPNSKEAMSNSRRPVTQAGFRNAINVILEATELGKKRDEVLVSCLGSKTFDNRPVYVICRIFTARRADYPAYIGITYIDKKLMVPVKVLGYDWDGRLTGLYTYTDIKINIGLTDEDFDTENPAYDFPGVVPFRKLSWPFGRKRKKE